MTAAAALHSEIWITNLNAVDCFNAMRLQSELGIEQRSKIKTLLSLCVAGLARENAKPSTICARCSTKRSASLISPCFTVATSSLIIFQSPIDRKREPGPAA
jgi:hypothetical protein